MATPRKNPRISVNKLAEYLDANSTRRRKIVFDAKYPSSFVTTRYKDAREIMKEFLLNHRNEDIVMAGIDTLTGKTPETDFQANDQQLSIDALEKMLETDLSVLDGCELSWYEEPNPLIAIGGVEISVNPDVKIYKNISGINNVGALKLHIIKDSLSEESQNIVGVMLQDFSIKYFKDNDTVVNPKLCISFDVFGKKLQCCPTGYKLRMNRIEAACEEIALWWDKL